MIRVRFRPNDAKGLIEQIAAAQAKRVEELEDAPWAYGAAFDPYVREATGEYVFTFKTGENFFDQLRLTNIAGNKLRKPEAIVKGRQVVVTYRPVAWDRASWHKAKHELEVKYPGVGVILALQEVALLSKKPR